MMKQFTYNSKTGSRGFGYTPWTHLSREIAKFHPTQLNAALSAARHTLSPPPPQRRFSEIPRLQAFRFCSSGATIPYER